MATFVRRLVREVWRKPLLWAISLGMVAGALLVLIALLASPWSPEVF